MLALQRLGGVHVPSRWVSIAMSFTRRECVRNENPNLPRCCANLYVLERKADAQGLVPWGKGEGYIIFTKPHPAPPRPAVHEFPPKFMRFVRKFWNY